MNKILLFLFLLASAGAVAQSTQKLTVLDTLRAKKVNSQKLQLNLDSTKITSDDYVLTINQFGFVGRKIGGSGGTSTPYTLPIASSSVLGGIKVGNGLTISNTGVLSVVVGSTNTYTKPQVDSAIAANKVRFGIEDNTGIVDRGIDMQGKYLDIGKGSWVSIAVPSGEFTTSGFYTDSTQTTIGAGGARSSEVRTQNGSVLLTASDDGTVSTNTGGLTLLRVEPKSVIVTGTYGLGGTETPKYLPLSVNGILADTTGNIDLGTIVGSAGVSSFNSRSGAVVSQFADYSAFYQPLGRYIDSLRRVGTTVSAHINGAWIPQYTDSVGVGATQVNSDWNASSGLAQILNKPTIPTTTSQLTNNSGFLTANQSITVTATGDATGTSTPSSTAPSLPLVLATVNSNVGTFGSTTQIPVVTVDAKGRVTGVTLATVSGGGGSITLTAIGTAPNANGASVSGSTLNLQPADTTYGGVLTADRQTINGSKFFYGDTVSYQKRGGGNFMRFVTNPNGTAPQLIWHYNGQTDVSIGSNSGGDGLLMSAKTEVGANIKSLGMYNGTSINSSFRTNNVPGGALALAPTSAPAFITYTNDGGFFAASAGTASSNGDYIFYINPADRNSFNGTEIYRIVRSSGNLLIGTSTDVTNVKFKVAGTDKTSHPYPNMTSTQRLALSMTSSNYGDHVYQTDGTEGVYVYKTSGWVFAY